MKRTSTLVGLVALGSATWAACGSPSELACTGVAIPGLAVSVREVTTELALHRDVTILVRSDDGFQESVTLTASSPPGAWSAAYERPGSYTVTVRRPGYHEWVRSGVVVEREDRCHVRTTFVTAELDPANEVRFTFTSAAGSGTVEARGVPRVPLDETRDFAALQVGRVNTTDVTHQPRAINAGSTFAANARDHFVLWLNPVITQPGTYAASACPQPADFGGCAHSVISIGEQVGVGPTLSLFQVANSVALTVLEITPERLRLSFEGRYVASRSGENLGEATVSGTIDVTRTSVP